MKYYDLPWPQRLAIMDACKAAGSSFDHGLTEGFRVAIGRGRLSATIAALEPLGFEFRDELHTFPLGTDKPPEHLRHDSMGIPSSVWLMAAFYPKGGQE